MLIPVAVLMNLKTDSLSNISEQQNKRIYLFIPGGFLCVNPSRI